MICECEASSLRILSLIEGSSFACAIGSAAATATTPPARNSLYFIRRIICVVGSIVPSEGGSYTLRKLRTTFAVHDDGGELLVLGEVDEVFAPRLGFGETLEIGE